MFLVRNVFRAKPAQAKALAAVFKKAGPHIEATGVVKNLRVMTDAVATFWTVVIESEVEDLNAYLDMARLFRDNKAIGEAMKGYVDLVDGGHREVFKIE